MKFILKFDNENYMKYLSNKKKKNDYILNKLDIFN